MLSNIKKYIINVTTPILFFIVFGFIYFLNPYFSTEFFDIIEKYFKDYVFLAIGFLSIVPLLFKSFDHRYSIALFQTVIWYNLMLFLSAIYKNELSSLLAPSIETFFYNNYFNHFFKIADIKKDYITLDYIFFHVSTILILSIMVKLIISETKRKEIDEKVESMVTKINNNVKKLSIYILYLTYCFYLLYTSFYNFNNISKNFDDTHNIIMVDHYKFIIFLIFFYLYINSGYKSLSNELFERNYMNVIKFVFIVNFVIALQIFFYMIVIPSYFLDTLLLFLLITFRDKINFPPPDKFFTIMFSSLVLYECIYFYLCFNINSNNANLIDAFYSISQNIIAFILFMYKDFFKKVISYIFTTATTTATATATTTATTATATPATTTATATATTTATTATATTATTATTTTATTATTTATSVKDNVIVKTIKKRKKIGNKVKIYF